MAEDAITVDVDAITVDEDAVTVDEDAVTVDEDALTVDEDAVAVDEDAITVDEDAITVDVDATTVDEDAVAVDEDAVAVDEDAVTVDEDAITVDEDATAVDEDAVTVDEDATTVDEDAITVDEDAVTVDEDTVTVDEDAVAVDEDAVTVDEDATTVDEDAVTVDEDAVTMDEDAITMDEEVDEDDAITVDDLLEVLQDDRFISVLADRLAVALTRSLTPRLENFFNELTEKCSATFQRSLEKSVTDVVARSSESINQKIETLEDKNADLRLRVDKAENYSRIDNLIIHGLPEPACVGITSGSSASQQSPIQVNEEAVRSVLSLCLTRLGLEINASDISSAHRIPRGKNDRHRPIIVRLTSRHVRNSIFAARKLLRASSSPSFPQCSDSTPVYINEHLTKRAGQIYARARSMVREKKIRATWTAGGTVFIRRTNSPDEKPTKIVSLMDLDRI